MFYSMLLRFFWITQLIYFSWFAVGSASTPHLLGLDVQANRKNDVAFVQAAAGLKTGLPITEYDFQTSLVAVKLTDRFRSVEGLLTPKGDGVVAKMQVDSWPALKKIIWCGDINQLGVKRLVRGLRTGMHPGNRKLTAWSQELQANLVEIGYPEANISWTREHSDEWLFVTIKTGNGTTIKRIDVTGRLAPFTANEIRHFAKLIPGHSLWNKNIQQHTVSNIYRAMRSRQHFEAKIDCKWTENGILNIDINSGPKIYLAIEDHGVSRFNHVNKSLIPLVRAEQYSPELLCEGDRRIVNHLQKQGYLSAIVWHQREEFDEPDSNKAVITYTVCRGVRTYVYNVHFIGNTKFTEEDLRRVALPSKTGLLAKGLRVSPDFLDSLESKVKSFYLSHGYADVLLRRQLEHKDGKAELSFKIKEGPQHLIKWLKVELPSMRPEDLWKVGESLTLILSDNSKRLSDLGSSRVYRSGRRQQQQHFKGVHGLLSLDNVPTGDVSVVALTLSKPIPLVKSDLVRIINIIKHQCLPSTSIVRPLMQFNLESADGVNGAFIKIPIQPADNIQRLVVTGSDKTRAKAIFREDVRSSKLTDVVRLDAMRSRLGNSGIFQRVDILSLLEKERSTSSMNTVRWKDGDLQLDLEEGSSPIITNSFSYDKNQGYRIVSGLTLLNIGGMGRTIDCGIRASSGFIKSSMLAKVFSTGMYDRSTDSITVSYTDPWFAPGAAKRFLADRTQYKIESVYTQERTQYLLNRLRVLSSLQWSTDSEFILQFGYRWDRINMPQVPFICDQCNFIISAPFAEVMKDTRDSPFDPTRGRYFVARMEFANRLFLTSRDTSFIKMEIKNQWIKAIGDNARKNGVVSLGLRLGVAKPTNKSSKEVPFSERFFAGGLGSFRALEPDTLGPRVRDVSCSNSSSSHIGDNVQQAGTMRRDPIGGQGMILINMEYRFPFLSRSTWGEIFVDSGQVYRSLSHHYNMHFPDFRTALGVGIIFKVGIPLKFEYAIDTNKLLRKHKDNDGKNSQFLFSAGFPF